jgi:hypothetical protein
MLHTSLMSLTIYSRPSKRLAYLSSSMPVPVFASVKKWLRHAKTEPDNFETLAQNEMHAEQRINGT